METANRSLQDDKNIAQVALGVAISQIGQQESPKHDNTGPMVNKYLEAVGLNPGYPWCQAFVNYCYEQAAKQLGVKEPVPNTGGVLDCWNKVSPNQKIMRVEALHRPQLILPGMQIIMKHSATTGHTGIVERVEGTTVHTIEGNTNEEGGREGYMVARKTRKMDDAQLLGFIKYV